MQPETDIGSELPWTLFDVAHPCFESDKLKVDMFWQLISHLNVRERQFKALKLN